jgi:hypothetical protein
MASAFDRAKFVGGAAISVDALWKTLWTILADGLAGFHGMGSLLARSSYPAGVAAILVLRCGGSG